MKKNYNPPPQIFDAAFLLVVAAEGGEKVTDDPRDPGGLTKWGICQRSYPDLDIRALTESDAREIYRRDYWDACKCDELPWPLSLYVFDAAINQACPLPRGCSRRRPT
jgi:lysozyme family protein